MIKKSLRNIFSFTPIYLKYDRDYNKKTVNLQHLIMGPIFEEVEKARKFRCNSKIKF